MTTTEERPDVENEIGKARRRKEDQRLITGRTRWTDNIRLNGMLYMAMVLLATAGLADLVLDVGPFLGRGHRASPPDEAAVCTAFTMLW